MGGQALNLWAERYNHLPELVEYGPYTSKDLDYFGYRQAAQKLADAIGGTIQLPGSTDHTVHATAIVRARLDGIDVEIDFLNHVKGVDPSSIEKQAVELLLDVRFDDGRRGRLHLPIMHPLHCLQSRLANVVDLGRDTDLAWRQLEASPIVLREYLSETLDDGGHKHVTGVLQSLHTYLLTDLTGRKAHKVMRNDPADVLRHFVEDDRLDSRWRELTLAPMLRRMQDLQGWESWQSATEESLKREHLTSIQRQLGEVAHRPSRNHAHDRHLGRADSRRTHRRPHRRREADRGGAGGMDGGGERGRVEGVEGPSGGEGWPHNSCGH